MNIWKPVAIGCIGYIAGINTRRNYGGNYYRGKAISLKDDLLDILVGKFYYLVWGETREQTNDRRLDRKFGRPVSYTPVYRSSYSDEMIRKIDEDGSDDNEEYNEN